MRVVTEDVSYPHNIFIAEKWQKLFRWCFKVQKILLIAGKKQNGKPIKYFAAMDDFRQLGKVEHKLQNIIAITIAAVICGCENWYEIEDYGRQKEAWLKTFRFAQWCASP